MCTQRTYECLLQSRASSTHAFADVFLAFCRTPLTLFKRLRKDGLKGAREALANWKPWIPTKQGQVRCTCRAAFCRGMLAPSCAFVASMGRRVRLVTHSPFFVSAGLPAGWSVPVRWPGAGLVALRPCHRSACGAGGNFGRGGAVRHLQGQASSPDGVDDVSNVSDVCLFDIEGVLVQHGSEL